MKYITSLIVVEDVTRARFFYETILRQKVEADFGENVAFEGGFAIHKRDHFQQLIDGLPVSAAANNFELYFEDDHLEEVEKTLKANHFELIHEIREQPWRQMVLRFYDADKNIIEVGENLRHTAYRLYLEKKPLDEIERITYLSREDVLSAIEEYNPKAGSHANQEG